MSKIKIGIVGLGWFGNRHLDYLLTRDDVAVTALANGGDAALQQSGAKVPGAKLYHSYEELLAGEAEIDALIVAVQPHRHGDVEKDAAARGIHLYIEKPIELSISKAEDNLKAIEAAGIITAVGYQERYNQGVPEAKAAIGDEPIGSITAWWVDHAPGALWWRDPAKSGGQIVEQATHVVDLLRYFAGEAEDVYGVMGSAYKHEDPTYKVDTASMCTIRFKSGAVGSLSTACYQDVDALPDNEVGVYINTRTKSIYYDQNDKVNINNAGKIIEYPSENNAHNRCLGTFVNAVISGDSSPIRSSYKDALESLRLTLALERSVRESRPIQVSEL
ncbi:MAG: Gfo/Idh/MocA family oxidoreductase [Clostridiales Family XIII bacterium]|jgi:predicted dehydrogenase|nr:Gfo/Idh/MocA family oxidoreductase [Clostridiales Family XIII bacterium]